MAIGDPATGKRQRWVVVVALCVVAVNGIGGYVFWSKMTSESPSAIRPSIVRPSATRGLVLKRYVDPQGQKHKYLVFVPYDYQPGQERPLLLFLNGKGEDGTDGVRSIYNNFGIAVWEMQRTFPFVVAIPQCRPGYSWVGVETERALAIMDCVARDYGTDPDRVYVTGVSSGGAGVWHIATRYPERFAAAVPLCGGGGGAEELARSRLPIWNFYNERDGAGLVESNRAMREAMLESGASPLATEYPRDGHNCWDLAYRSVGMYDWLLDQSLPRSTRRYSLLSPEQILSAWTPCGSAKWTARDDLALGCVNEASEVPGYLISDVAFAAGEFHVDVYFGSESEQCRLGLFDVVNNDFVEGYTLHVEFAGAGSGGLSHSKNGWIATLDPAAQRQLRTDHWNDIRLRFGERRITARINGWKAIDVQTPESEKRCYPALIAPNTSSGIRWQNVRLRALD